MRGFFRFLLRLPPSCRGQYAHRLSLLSQQAASADCDRLTDAALTSSFSPLGAHAACGAFLNAAVARLRRSTITCSTVALPSLLQSRPSLPCGPRLTCASVPTV